MGGDRIGTFQLEWGSNLQLTTGILLNKLTELTLFYNHLLTKFTMVHINYTYRMPCELHHFTTTEDSIVSWVGLVEFNWLNYLGPLSSNGR